MFSKKSNSKVAKFSDPEKRFKLGECLGKGAFASVYRAVDRVDRKECAIKKMALNNPLCAGQQPITEFLIGKTLIHPCIVETLDS
jgi:serine/threonine protein kinase